jgi:isoleucyl-tRNA synthetase
MHYGHILNNALKDFVTRSRNLLGERTRFIPGWDCHGLPIELNVDREVKRKKEHVSPTEMRVRCRDEAAKWVDVQRTERKRLGVLGTWETPYLTMNQGFEAQVIRALKAFVANDIVYRGKKPVQWCWHCRTALAEAEVEYADAHVSPSIYVKFALDAGGRRGPAREAPRRRHPRLRRHLDHHPVDHPGQPRHRGAPGAGLRGAQGRRR